MGVGWGLYGSKLGYVWVWVGVCMGLSWGMYGSKLGYIWVWAVFEDLCLMIVNFKSVFRQLTPDSQ